VDVFRRDPHGRTHAVNKNLLLRELRVEVLGRGRVEHLRLDGQEPALTTEDHIRRVGDVPNPSEKSPVVLSVHGLGEVVLGHQHEAVEPDR
jgi:hypothetical protein